MKKIDSKTFEIDEGFDLVMDDCGHPYFVIVSTRDGDHEWTTQAIEKALLREGLQVWCDTATWHHERDWSTILVREGGYHENAAPTFKQTKQGHLDNLKSLGWSVATYGPQGPLKVPHATSPAGQWRVWFKAQAVYFLHGPPFEFGRARSLTDDMRQPTENILRMIDRATAYEAKNYPRERDYEGVERVSGGQRANSSSHYVWPLKPGSNAPLSIEGPFGPYPLHNAKTTARIRATEGGHDYAVTRGADPETFEVVAVYARGTGENLTK